MALYSLVKAEQFVNTKDDRQRGIGSNPFGNYKDLTPTTKQNHKGALPGDYDLFKFAHLQQRDAQEACRVGDVLVPLRLRPRRVVQSDAIS